MSSNTFSYVFKVMIVLIFLTSFFASGLSNLDGYFHMEAADSSPQVLINSSTPIQANLSIDHVPLVGEEATLTCDISSILDAPGTTAVIELPSEAQLVSGVTNWQGDLLAGETVQIKAVVVFNSPSEVAIFCRALKVVDESEVWGDLAELYLSISQADSQAGFLAIPSNQRHQLGELAEAGDGQLLNEAKAQAALPTQDEIFEPPSIDPIMNSDDSPNTFSNDQPTGSLVVTGRWGYYDRDDIYTGAREFLVELVQGDNYDHLAWCYTDLSGDYSCGPVTNPGSAGVRTIMYSFSSYNPYSDMLVVINPDWGTVGSVGNSFGTQTGVSVFSDGTHDIGSWNSTNGSTYERAYWIQRDLNDAWRYIWFGTGLSQIPDETTGPTTVEWKIDSTDGTYYNNGGNIHLTGADPLSNTVVNHEYGHNIMYTIYGNTMPTTYCPYPHYLELSSHVNCAWTEGWANFFAIAVNNDPVYRWASGASLNLENPTWGTPIWNVGDAVEGRVAGALWDILDNSNEGDDQYSDGGIANIWDTIYHQNDDNFSQYWSAWKSRGHDNSSAGPVMSIYHNTIDYRGGPPNDDFVNAAIIGGLPYTVSSLDTANATTQGNDPGTSCGSGSIPKQSRSVWYRFTPSVTHDYVINTNGSNYDTVLAVWTGSFGALVQQGCDDDGGTGIQSQLILTLNAGTTYHIEALGYGSGSGGSLDFSVGAYCGTPEVPILVSPLDGSSTTDNTPAFNWNTTNYSTQYHIEVDNNNDFSSPAYSELTGALAFTPGAILGDGMYYWRVRGRNFTNYCSGYGTWSTQWSVRIDTLAPTGSITINGGATYATSTAVTLNLSASDSGSGMSQMRFSNDGSTWSGWESYAVTKGWTLSPGDGTKTVYVQYIDTAGNISTSYSDSIMFDTIAPSSSVVSPTRSATFSFEVSWSGNDNLSGVANYDVQYRIGTGGTWNDWLLGTTSTSGMFGPTIPVSTVLGETYFFRIRAHDNAGNIEGYPADADTSTLIEEEIITFLPLVIKN
jgi:hypothetical protein